MLPVSHLGWGPGAVHVEGEPFRLLVTPLSILLSMVSKFVYSSNSRAMLEWGEP